ncbi:YciI family protein [Antrihabitans cavernicola]|uniref:YCII-related domain-containing protein n=1 Tax=Antrihabitans cavernicola TaxID=2495913 RepID=A0A5A7SBN0_9NOCA|nr:YciI family protein [Spelaeibacter cavernicola]KAA0023326.1 hypothetical protein FOY51_07875 [Spelaeibacter cavernicola]
MALFAVEYSYDPATSTDRDAHRPAHRAWLGGLVEQGVVRSSGPYPDGSGALIIVEAADTDAVAARLSEDPFAKAGLIENVRVNEWTPVMGTFS